SQPAMTPGVRPGGASAWPPPNATPQPPCARRSNGSTTQTGSDGPNDEPESRNPPDTHSMRSSPSPPTSAASPPPQPGHGADADTPTSATSNSQSSPPLSQPVAGRHRVPGSRGGGGRGEPPAATLHPGVPGNSRR